MRISFIALLQLEKWQHTGLVNSLQSFPTYHFLEITYLHAGWQDNHHKWCTTRDKCSGTLDILGNTSECCIPAPSLLDPGPGIYSILRTELCHPSPEGLLRYGHRRRHYRHRPIDISPARRMRSSRLYFRESTYVSSITPVPREYERPLQSQLGWEFWVG